MDIRFIPATAADEPAIRSLLSAADLPHGDIAPHLPSFIIALRGNTLIGAIGLEQCGDAALLRSFAVAAPRRNGGIGSALYSLMEECARMRGVKTLYLLTQTARAFFAARGYALTERDAAPASVRQTSEFAEFCPQSATCMKKEI